jgi:hypothetical protein
LINQRYIIADWQTEMMPCWLKWCRIVKSLNCRILSCTILIFYWNCNDSAMMIKFYCDIICYFWAVLLFVHYFIQSFVLCLYVINSNWPNDESIKSLRTQTLIQVLWIFYLNRKTWCLIQTLMLFTLFLLFFFSMFFS